jgi:hypothetical protein
LIRLSLDFASHKDRGAACGRVAAGLHGAECRGGRAGVGGFSGRHVGQAVADVGLVY